jgi:uroporphyrin-III C-methyltransferase
VTTVRTAVVLAAHGSWNDPTVTTSIDALAARLAARGIADRVVTAFHAGAPGFTQVLDLIDADRIAVVPLFTSDGYFNRVVLPQELRRNVTAAQKRWRLTAPVGTHPDWIAHLSASVTARAHAHGITMHGAEVVVVGHGTTREPASQTSTALLADGIATQLGVRATPFYLDAEPSLESAWAATSGAHLFVVPFLFGGGHLRDDIPARLGVHASRTASVLGGLLQMDSLDDIVAARAAEGLRDVGTVHLVGAGPGDPELITVRGLRLLREADVVLYDRLVAPALLSEARADAVLVDVGKRGGDESVAQEAINALLVEHAHAGRNVVRLKGGDAFVFGRGSEEVDACAAAQIPCVVVPGVSSAIAAAASAGIPVTERGVARSFAVVTARTAADGAVASPAIGSVAHADTIVVMMGRRALAEVTVQLMHAGRDPATPVALVSRGTLPDQRVVRSTLANAAIDAERALLASPMVLIVGMVTRRAMEMSR